MQYCSPVTLHYKSFFPLIGELILKSCRTCRETRSGTTNFPPLARSLVSFHPLCLLSLALFFCVLSPVKIQLRECFGKSHFSCSPLERACSKLFQLTNLRRLEISPDPETSSRHLVGSLQADLKGKLIFFLLFFPHQPKARLRLRVQLCVGGESGGKVTEGNSLLMRR